MTIKLRKVTTINRHNPLFSFWAPLILKVLRVSFSQKRHILDMGLPIRGTLIGLKALGRARLSSHTEEMQQGQSWWCALVSHGRWVPPDSLCRVMDCMHPLRAAGEDPLLFPRWPEKLVGLARLPMKHMLKQNKEVHCIPRTGERFLLRRKKIWDQVIAQCLLI